MPPTVQKITPFLWFNTRAMEAATLYTSLFDGSAILETMPGPDGGVMTVIFELAGQRFIALNGGGEYRFSEAISFAVSCDSQAEVDRLWNALIDGGGQPGQCGWLKDRFGVSWQIVPTILPKLLKDPDRQKAGRAMQAMLSMGRLVIADLEAAARGA